MKENGKRLLIAQNTCHIKLQALSSSNMHSKATWALIQLTI